MSIVNIFVNPRSLNPGSLGQRGVQVVKGPDPSQNPLEVQLFLMGHGLVTLRRPRSGCTIPTVGRNGLTGTGGAVTVLPSRRPVRVRQSTGIGRPLFPGPRRRDRIPSSGSSPGRGLRGRVARRRVPGARTVPRGTVPAPIRTGPVRVNVPVTVGSGTLLTPGGRRATRPVPPVSRRWRRGSGTLKTTGTRRPLATLGSNLPFRLPRRPVPTRP